MTHKPVSREEGAYSEQSLRVLLVEGGKQRVVVNKVRKHVDLASAERTSHFVRGSFNIPPLPIQRYADGFEKGGTI